MIRASLNLPQPLPENDMRLVRRALEARCYSVGHAPRAQDVRPMPCYRRIGIERLACSAWLLTPRPPRFDTSPST